jgi:hypothetical protein
MSECKTCGRDDGHWLGCAEAHAPKPEPEHPIAADHGPVPAECSFEGCEEERWSTAPAAKFCETHRDPKNRK